MSTMRVETIVKIGKANAQCVGPGTREKRRHLRKEFHSTELADIVVKQSAIVELENRARIFGSRAVPQKLARHSQVYV